MCGGASSVVFGGGGNFNGWEGFAPPSPSVFAPDVEQSRFGQLCMTQFASRRPSCLVALRGLFARAEPIMLSSF